CAARRRLRVEAQARSRPQGHGRVPAGPRWRPRPHRRTPVRDPGHLLPGQGPEVDVSRTTIALVGSTGSIGTQAIEVVDAEPDRYEVVALGAARSVDVLASQARRLRPRCVAIADESLAADLRARLPAAVRVTAGAGAPAAT